MPSSAGTDSSFLFFQRDSDSDSSPSSFCSSFAPSIKTTRVIHHSVGFNRSSSVAPVMGGGGKLRSGSVPPVSASRSLHSSSHSNLQPSAASRSLRASSVRPAGLSSGRASSVRPAGLSGGSSGSSGYTPFSSSHTASSSLRSATRAYSPTRTTTRLTSYDDPDFSSELPFPTRSSSRLDLHRAAGGTGLGGVGSLASYRRPISRASTPSHYYRVSLPSSSYSSGGGGRGGRGGEPTVTAVRVESKAREDEYVSNGRPSYKRQDATEFVPHHQQENLTDLISRTKVARDHLSKHRVLLDRYLPLNLGPSNDVQYEVEYKYGELLSRMPQLENQRRKRDELYEDHSIVSSPRSSIIAPYKPAPKPVKLELPPQLPAIRNSFTPKISDTRKRARSVLCKVKGDPHYFSF